MAEKEKERKAESAPKIEPPPAAAPVAKGGGLLSKMPVVLGGVMVLEAVVLFAGFKFLSPSPHAAAGAALVEPEAASEGHGGEHGDGAAKGPVDKKKMVELAVVEFKAPNKRNGRTYLFDVSIFANVKSDQADKVKESLKDREALVADRVRTIIAQSDPEKLSGAEEPGLETLRRQVKYQLDEIVGEGAIDEILVKRCIGFRSDY